MASYEHGQLVDRFTRLDICPVVDAGFAGWQTGVEHLDLLRKNASGPELVVTALSTVVFVHAAVVPVDDPGLRNLPKLLDWNVSLFHHSAATHGWVVTNSGAHVERVEYDWGSTALSGTKPLVYGRMIDGLDEPEACYYEIAQDFTHSSEIHWRRERSAHAKLDSRGNWIDVVSITRRESSSCLTLITFSRDVLDEYLVQRDAVLVRLFDFTFFRPGSLPNWSKSTKTFHEMGEGIVYSQQCSADNSIAALRGIQILRPLLSREEVVRRVLNITDDTEQKYFEFEVLDFRNQRMSTVSTDPSTTTNYFDSRSNSLPFETSPAFFDPEVLLRYKHYTDKYDVREDSIHCRGGWYLRKYGTNAADQVFAYICDLRTLPTQEQQYWSSFNQPARAGLPDDVIKTDFIGDWSEDNKPLDSLVDLLGRWNLRQFSWWEWRDEREPARLTVPRTGSRDEWANAIVALNRGLIEGFNEKHLKELLKDRNCPYEPNDKSIRLLERLVQHHGTVSKDWRLTMLRCVHKLRSVAGKVHATGEKGVTTAKKILAEHGTFAAHFEWVCGELERELELIETAAE